MKYLNEIKRMLEEYTGRELSAWHMPGHKRKPVFPGFWEEMFRYDVTEVPGTDDLHHASGAIRRSQEEAAGVYGADFSHYLVGGSTAGILASIGAATKLWREKRKTRKAPTFLVASNCHKSVWNGLRLVGAKTIPVTPAEDPVYGPVLSDELLRVLSEKIEDSDQVAGCILTSPTYAGVISPLGELHAVLEVYGIPLIVDEAHGAHLPFCRDPALESGVSCGAEYVVQSLHKTLPALTQTAILHVNGEKEADEAVTEQLAVFESSSPSYILMLSAEQAVAWADRHREELMAYPDRMREFREELSKELKHLELVKLPGNQDPSRIMLQARRETEVPEESRLLLTGTGMAAWLERETGVVAELAGSREVILLSSVCDEEEDLRQLKDALLRLDEEIGEAVSRETEKKQELQRLQETRELQESKESEKSEEFEEAEDTSASEDDITEVLTGPGPAVQAPLLRVGDFVQRDIYVYPPGVPILRSGERVTESALKRLEEERAAGRRIYGL